MIPSNFEARRFGEGRSHAEALAAWCGGMTYLDDQDQRFVTTADNRVAWPGDWIVRLPDGTFRVDGPGGSQDGYCTDCGEPVWWHGEELVGSFGVRWCYGPDRSRVSMERHHALPGMHQFAARAPEGQPCECLARSWPHVHQIVPVPGIPAGTLREGVPDRRERPGYHGQGELADFDPGTGRSSWDDWGEE